MENNIQLIYKIVHARLGNDAHVGISKNGSVTLFITNPNFISAVGKMDINKNLSPFVQPLQRTDAETAFLKDIVACMRECHFFNLGSTISLLHPFDDDKVLFSTKQVAYHAYI